MSPTNDPDREPAGGAESAESAAPAPAAPPPQPKPDEKPATRGREIGGPKGPEPTRYGDWERNGRCSDF